MEKLESEGGNVCVEFCSASILLFETLRCRLKGVSSGQENRWPHYLRLQLPSK